MRGFSAALGLRATLLFILVIKSGTDFHLGCQVNAISYQVR